MRRWLATRTDRERRLVVVAVAIAVATLAGRTLLGAYDDLARLRARVDAHERELAQIRRLAASVGDAPAPASDDAGLITRLEAAADGAGLADRVAAMTPGTTTEGGAATRLALRVSGASLGETVALLHVLDRDAPPIRIARLAFRKHPDDPRRFDVTVEVAGARAP